MDIVIKNLNLSLISSGLQESHSEKYKPMTKENCPDGVYIFTETGQLWLPQFFGLCNDKATAVALIKGDKRLLISLNSSEKDIPMLPKGEKTSLVKLTSVEEALTDYAGYSNTEELLKAGSEAAKFCKEIGAEWYIPAFAEKNIMFESKKEIDAALTIAGGEPLYCGWHWTSTRYSDGSYWVFYWDYGRRNDDDQIFNYRVSPVSAF